MTPRPEVQNCQFFTTPLSRNSQKRLEHKENQIKYRKMTRKPRSRVRFCNISNVGKSGLLSLAVFMYVTLTSSLALPLYKYSSQVGL